jgi:hypothetical protein
VRKATINRNGTLYRDKQECLDQIEYLERMRISVYGIEIVHLTANSAETSMYKTLWFHNQEQVYELSRTFIAEQMAGIWNYAEIKI